MLTLAAILGALIGACLMWVYLIYQRVNPLERRLDRHRDLDRAALAMVEHLYKRVKHAERKATWSSVVDASDQADVERVRTTCCDNPMISLDDPHMRASVMFNPYNKVVACHHCGHVYLPANDNGTDGGYDRQDLVDDPERA